MQINWLSENHALVDCHINKITFKIPKKEEFVFRSSSQKPGKNILLVIFATRMWRSLKRGCIRETCNFSLTKEDHDKEQVSIASY